MPDARPPVGIGLPVRNGENYLREALESLLGQTMTDFELVISDNCSEDDTEEICRDAARDPRVRYIRQPANLGAAANYNLVFEETRGEFFRWASHDDLSAPDHLERCLATFGEESADTVLVYPRTMLIDEAGNPLGLHDDDLEMTDASPRKRLQRFARSWGMCNPVMGLMRREAAQRTRLIDTFPSSDLVLLAELALLGRVVEIPEPLFLRRIHSGSAMQGSGGVDPATWLDPSSPRRSRGRTNSTLPILREVLRSVNRSGLPATTRISVAAGVSSAWLARRARVHLGAARGSLVDRISSSSERISQSSR